MPENYLFMPIFNPLLTTDRHCGIQQVQIPLVSLHKRALKAILPKNTTITISDNNFLSILPLKERLNYNKEVLIHKIMSGKVPPSLTANFCLNQSRHSGKLNVPNTRTDLFMPSLIYSGMFFGTHSLAL